MTVQKDHTYVTRSGLKALCVKTDCKGDRPILMLYELMNQTYTYFVFKDGAQEIGKLNDLDLIREMQIALVDEL